MNSLFARLILCLMTVSIHQPSIALSANPATAIKTTPSVNTAVVEQKDVPVLLEVVGTLQAVERAAISAKVTGVIIDVPVVLGSRIQKGDLLIAISAEEINARLKQAEAQLRQAERNLAREQKLLKKNATTSETVKSMQDRYRVAKASYLEVKTMLGYTTIKAPFDGVVSAKKVHRGDLAVPGTVLLSIENNKKLQVATAVPESLVQRIRPGDELQVYIPSTDVPTSGTVAEIAPSADPSSRTAPVTIDLPFDERFRSGQFARVMLPGKEQQSLFIPSGAVVAKGQMERVFVVEENRARLRLVRTGMTHNGMVEILSGLKAGEQVIIDNNTLLINGQPVNILK